MRHSARRILTRLAHCGVLGEPLIAQRKVHHRPPGAWIVHLLGRKASFYCSQFEVASSRDRHDKLRPCVFGTTKTRTATARSTIIKIFHSVGSKHRKALCTLTLALRQANGKRQFHNGPPANEPERLSSEEQVRVSIAAPFAVGKFAVIFNEWDACVADGGCNGHRPKDERWGRASAP